MEIKVLNTDKLKTFRSKLSTEMPLFGLFMKSLDPAFIEIAGLSGFDYVILDMEHGPISTDRLGDLIRAAAISGLISIVRVPETNEQAIGKALDLGACGIQIPQIKTADEAIKAVHLSKFYPKGERGVCRFVRAAGYSSIPGGKYFHESNESLLILQLEGKEALTNIDEILDVKDIDIFFIGPYDLSQSLGIPGDVKSPLVRNAMFSIISKAKQAGKAIGTFVDDMESAKYWVDAGIQYISYSVDVGIFYEACAAINASLQSLWV